MGCRGSRTSRSGGNAVFLPDLLMQDNSSVRLDQLSAYGRHAVEQAVEALRQVHDMVGRSITDVIRAAIER